MSCFREPTGRIVLHQARLKSQEKHGIREAAGKFNIGERVLDFQAFKHHTRKYAFVFKKNITHRKLFFEVNDAVLLLSLFFEVELNNRRTYWKVLYDLYCVFSFVLEDSTGKRK